MKRSCEDTYQNHAPWEEGRTQWDSEAARKYHKGSGFLKRSAKEEERRAKGAQRQFRYFTTASLIYITFAGAPVACPFLPSQYSSHHNLIFFFFNEIGQLNKGQISELKQISLGLARGSFNRSLKPWASTNRRDASVGEKKYEKDKEERVYILQMTHTRKSIRILLINTAAYHVAQLQMDPSRPPPNDKNKHAARRE